MPDIQFGSGVYYVGDKPVTKIYKGSIRVYPPPSLLPLPDSKYEMFPRFETDLNLLNVLLSISDIGPGLFSNS